MPENNVEEKLDSPLVVHKKSDASYQENASEVSMNATHTDDESSDSATLERHRFKKKKSKKHNPMLLVGFVVIIAAVVGALIHVGVIDFKPEETTEESTMRSYTTQVENDFKGTIVVKGTYIFFEGEEINGIRDLERNVKYLKSGTHFIIKDEHADSDYLNNEVLPVLSKYEIDYEITHIESSGLIAENEITTVATTTIATTTSAAATDAESTLQDAE